VPWVGGRVQRSQWSWAPSGSWRTCPLNWRTLHKFQLEALHLLDTFRLHRTHPFPPFDPPASPHSTLLYFIRKMKNTRKSFVFWSLGSSNNLPLKAQHCYTGFSLFTKYRVCVTHKKKGAWAEYSRGWTGNCNIHPTQVRWVICSSFAGVFCATCEVCHSVSENGKGNPATLCPCSVHLPCNPPNNPSTHPPTSVFRNPLSWGDISI